MAGNEPFGKKWTRFCETILREGGFAKPRLKFFKFGGIWVSAPQEGAGGMRGELVFGNFGMGGENGKQNFFFRKEIAEFKNKH